MVRVRIRVRGVFYSYSLTPLTFELHEDHHHSGLASVVLLSLVAIKHCLLYLTSIMIEGHHSPKLATKFGSHKELFIILTFVDL